MSESLRDKVDGAGKQEEMRQTIARLGQQLVRAKAKKEEMVNAVFRAARDAALGLDIPEVQIADWVRAEVEGEGKEEVLVPLYSDLQLAKVTPTYDSKVCEQRVELYANKLVQLAEITRNSRPVREAHICAVGDIVEGELIFPGQSFLIDSSLYRQVTVDGPRITANFIRILLAGGFEKVHVWWVIGNHGAIGGRSRRDMHPETNADRMLGQILNLMFEGDDRVIFHVVDDDNPSYDIPEAGSRDSTLGGSRGRGEHNFYQIARIGEYRPLLLHGDQFNSQAGLPFYSFQKKVNSWAAGAIPVEPGRESGESFDDVFCGHWHQTAKIPLNFRHVYVNGSPEDTNTYAIEKLSSATPPAQTALFVNPRKSGSSAVTAVYDVRLDED